MVETLCDGKLSGSPLSPELGREMAFPQSSAFAWTKRYLAGSTVDSPLTGTEATGTLFLPVA